MREANRFNAREAIRHAGSIQGLVVMRGSDVVFEDSPYDSGAVTELAATLDDIAIFFEQENRGPDQLAFGYDGGNVLVLLLGEFRMVILHQLVEEVDFVARAGRAFLKDCAMDLLARDFAPSGRPR